MTNEDLQQQTHRALLMFIAIAKVQDNAYTRFLGMFKHNEKRKFNEFIIASNSFCKTVEANLPTESVEAADKLEEYFQDFIFTLIQKGDFTRDDNHSLKQRLNKMLEDPERLEYDIYSINHVLKLLDKTNF